MRVIILFLSLVTAQAGEAGEPAAGGGYRLNLRSDYILAPSLGVEIGEHNEVQVGPEFRLIRKFDLLPGGFMYLSVGSGFVSYVIAVLLESGVFETDIYQIEPGFPTHTGPSGADESDEMDIYPPLVVTAGYEKELSDRWDFRMGLSLLWWAVKFQKEDFYRGRLYPFLDIGFTMKIGGR